MMCLKRLQYTIKMMCLGRLQYTVKKMCLERLQYSVSKVYLSSRLVGIPFLSPENKHIRDCPPSVHIEPLTTLHFII